MPAAPILMDEPCRLDALNCLAILDTPPEARFDRLVVLAQAAARSDAALVCFVDAERQWFKAKVGIDATGTERDISFCTHAILSDAVTWVENAATDPRFAENPLVLGGPCIRFYAGAPIQLAGGERVGTVCVLGKDPRPHDPVIDVCLKYIADLAAEQLQRR